MEAKRKFSCWHRIMKSTVTQISQCRCAGALTRTTKTESIGSMSFVLLILCSTHLASVGSHSVVN